MRANTPGFPHRYGAMIFIAAIPIGFQIANQKTTRRAKFERALTGWGRTDDNLPSESIFSQILYSTFKSLLFGSSCETFQKILKREAMEYTFRL